MAISGRTDAPPAWAQMSGARRAHVRRVVALLDAWADAHRTDPGERVRWQRAGWFHDALKDAPPEELEALLDAEFANAVPALWHGPAAAARAAAEGETDQGVLAAVRYHTVGFAGWDAAGVMLFLADFLEPGRPFHGPEHAAWTARIAAAPAAVRDVTREVLAARIAHRRDRGRGVHPRTEEWWNALS